MPGGGSGAGAPVLDGPGINLVLPSEYPRKGICGASAMGGKRVVGGGPLVGKNGGGGILRSVGAELRSGSTPWLVKAVPNSLPTGSNGSGSPTEPVVRTSACDSRVFCEILLSRLARLVYDRALDWIVRNPAPMHYQEVSRPHPQARVKDQQLTRASTTSHFIPTRSASPDQTSFRIVMYSLATISNRLPL